MFKSKAPDKEKNAVANAAEVVGSTAQQQHSVVEHPPATLEPTKAGTRSCIGSGMSIVGDIECNGPAQVFGRIKGELRASDLLIGDGALVEGSVIAQDVNSSSGGRRSSGLVPARRWRKNTSRSRR